MIHNKVIVNHLGFLCESAKNCLVTEAGHSEFEVQDMGVSAFESLDKYENWKAVFKGKLEAVGTAMGSFYKGDFSEITTPGVYRVVITGTELHSFQFVISDGAFSVLPHLFLDFIHNWRSGDFENDWRGPSHLDDAIRSDNGEAWDGVGGWYDAGDTRKWMTTSNLPALAFMDMAERNGWQRSYFLSENVVKNDLLTEAVWGVKYIMKMQDPETGMIFEEIGGGGEGRKTSGMSWWYENLSGAYADNSQNTFTDNISNSGDERTLRVQYNPIVQYINLTILQRASVVYVQEQSQVAEECAAAAWRIWEYVLTKRDTCDLHQWTSTKSWQACAAIELYKAGKVAMEELEQIITELIGLQSGEHGFWFMDSDRKDPYRAVIHSAQPIIALATFVEICPRSTTAKQATASIKLCVEKYVLKAIKTNPFGIVPYGCFYKAATEGETYRDFGDGLKFRFYMPQNSPQKVNVGLAGHWTSWAHGLAMAAEVLGEPSYKTIAWKQLYWLLGSNTLNTCLVTGVGYNHPMPHSRFLGTYPGGFSAGPRGDEQDEIVIDHGAHAEWNSTEYWNVPLANTLMAFAILLPKKVEKERKLGFKARD